MGYTRTVIKRCGPDGRCRDGEDEDTQRGEHGTLGRHVIVAMVTEIRMAFLTTVAKSLLLLRSLCLRYFRRFFFLTLLSSSLSISDRRCHDTEVSNVLTKTSLTS